MFSCVNSKNLAKPSQYADSIEISSIHVGQNHLGSEKDFDVFKIYPNLSADFINIEFAGFVAKENSLEIFDFYGYKIMEIPILTERNLIRLDISSFSSGLYFIKGNYKNGKIITEKFIKI